VWDIGDGFWAMDSIEVALSRSAGAVSRYLVGSTASETNGDLSLSKQQRLTGRDEVSRLGGRISRVEFISHAD